MLISDFRTPTGQTDICLSFKYSMNGDETMGSLNVLVDDGTQEEEVFEESGDKGADWQDGSVRIPARPSGYEIVFEVETGTSYRSDIALDDISITACGNGTSTL